MLWHKFRGDNADTKKYYCEYMYCLYTGKRKISVENITFYLLKSVLDTTRSSYAIDKP